MSGYDFNHSADAWTSTPIFYRQPTEPADAVYFRRPGPAAWTGKVLTTRLRQLGIPEWNAYADEAEQTIAYDQDGFRNPANLADWRIVVVGDSFTELGYLPHHDLFSSRIADGLDVRVKNLGVSFTGTLSHCYYLREHGIAESTTDVLLVFFEGNDVDETLEEYSALQRWRSTGERDYRDLTAGEQTSFIRAAAKILSQATNGETEPDMCNEIFTTGDQHVDVTVMYTPSNKADLIAEARTAVRYALADYAAIATVHHLRPWLVYMPCKRRILDGHLVFSEHASRSLVDWLPSDLPRWVEEICEHNEIRFVDLTPILAEQASLGQLTYNHTWDTHLNRDGALLVAKVISDSIGREWKQHSTD